MAQFNRVRIQDIYLEALELPDSERIAFIEKACAGNPDCIGGVKSLLDAAVRPSILDVPVVEVGWAPDSLVGTTIDNRYEVEKELAPSGMGKVYLAHNLQLPGRFVVIKVLPHASTRDPDAVRRFKVEIQALKLIDHPGVVSVLGAGELKDGNPYIVMQYIDGLTLRSEIAAGGMDAIRAAGLIKQIGSAVGHVHDKGILHRDLKPENIMLQLLSDGTEIVKIVDFGIAKIMDSVGVTGAVNTVPIGTLAYMSPEQLRGGEIITAASDIYSIAVVVCEMITGERPNQPEPGSQGRWRPKRVELPKDISTKARNLLTHALSFDPKNRPQSARKFTDELTEALIHPKVPGPTRLITKLLIITAGVFILGLLSYEIYKYLVKPQLQPQTQPRSLTSPAQSKGFNYWIMVQRTHDGKDYEAPYKSNGDDVFEKGDKFQLNVQSVYSGYIYIFYDRAPEPDSARFRMIYPNKSINDATVGANHTVLSDWISFRGPAGSENFWIVWSASPIAELESAKATALTHPQAGLTDQNLVKVKEYLKTMDAEVNARAAKIKDSQHVQVRKRSDIVLTQAEFKHR